MIAVLAENDFGDNIGDGLAGPMGLLIILLMVIATVLLMRNMNARLRRLPERFPNHPDGPAAQGGSGPAGAEPTAGPADTAAGGTAALDADAVVNTPTDGGGGSATLDADAVVEARPADSGTAGHP